MEIGGGRGGAAESAAAPLFFRNSVDHGGASHSRPRRAAALQWRRPQGPLRVRGAKPPLLPQPREGARDSMRCLRRGWYSRRRHRRSLLLYLIEHLCHYQKRSRCAHERWAGPLAIRRTPPPPPIGGACGWRTSAAGKRGRSGAVVVAEAGREGQGAALPSHKSRPSGAAWHIGWPLSAPNALSPTLRMLLSADHSLRVPCPRRPLPSLPRVVAAAVAGGGVKR